MSESSLWALVWQALATWLAHWMGWGEPPADAPPKHLQGWVTEVADGDTLTVQAGLQSHRIRLGGVDAPETEQAHGSRSRAALALMCLGRPVDLDMEDRDRYQRLVGQVRCQGEWANAELVRQGHAWVYRQHNRHPEFEALEAQARAQRRGLWAQEQPTPPWVWRQDNKR
jgi:endonuclease YncB( thermonuclease family)